MVGYQEWVSIVFDVSKSKGALISSLNESQEVLEVAAGLWSENPFLKTASRAEARAFADDQIVIS